jgi:tripartite-type tricarboxylate transporter receptor subunit TctC
MIKLLRAITIVLVVPFVCLSSALASDYPSKPVKIIVPFPAGGAADTMMRRLAQKMSEDMHGVFIIDNRGGANGIIGMELGAHAAPDGYTLVLGSTSSMPMNAAINPNLPFDPVKDFAPISCFSYSPLILVVNPSVPAQTVAEYIALAKQKPGQISYASFGVGSTAHFAGELFSQMAGIKLFHVPYSGSAGSTVDLLSGHVMSGFDTMQNSTPYIRSGMFRPLGIAALKRSTILSDVPTISESGLPGFEIGSTFGLLAPADTPRDILMKLHDAMARVLVLPEIIDYMASVGTEPYGNTPEQQYASWIRSEMLRWADVARRADMHV